MLDIVNSDEQAEVASVFKDVRERAIGFDLAADRIDSFMDELEAEDALKDMGS